MNVEATPLPTKCATGVARALYREWLTGAVRFCNYHSLSLLLPTKSPPYSCSLLTATIIPTESLPWSHSLLLPTKSPPYSCSLLPATIIQNESHSLLLPRALHCTVWCWIDRVKVTTGTSTATAIAIPATAVAPPSSASEAKKRVTKKKAQKYVVQHRVMFFKKKKGKIMVEYSPQ